MAVMCCSVSRRHCVCSLVCIHCFDKLLSSYDHDVSKFPIQTRHSVVPIACFPRNSYRSRHRSQLTVIWMYAILICPAAMALFGNALWTGLTVTDTGKTAARQRSGNCVSSGRHFVRMQHGPPGYHARTVNLTGQHTRLSFATAMSQVVSVRPVYRFRANLICTMQSEPNRTEPNRTKSACFHQHHNFQC